MTSPASYDLHTMLREATRPAHDCLDDRFAAIDLHERAGLTRFLGIHRAALERLVPHVERFAAREQLGPVPDFVGMLDEDLAELGSSRIALPPLCPSSDGLGLTYVVAGSRLGLAVLRRRGYWGQSSRFLEDRSGRELWRRLLACLEERSFSADEHAAAVAGALSGFAIYEDALAACSIECEA